LSSKTERHSRLHVIGPLTNESLYVGIDIGKQSHVAGFVSQTLLTRHERFEGCPVLQFEQSREGFRTLVDRIQSYVPLSQAYVLLEKTGHYHKALVQYLQELDLSVYLTHVQTRPSGMMKTDKRDALGLANTLYNQLEKGIQVADKTHLVRRAVAPSTTVVQLKGLIRHRYELIHESTQRKNKLIAICDELFPEFTRIFKDPNLTAALALREQFPTPQAVAIASLSALREVRKGKYPSDAQLGELQRLASQSIGTKDLARQRCLKLEQGQLIKELHLLREHIQQLETEITQLVAQSREGRILTSIPPIGPIQAATLLSAMGHIDNFASAAALKSYFGWAPTVTQSGTSLDHTHLTRAGTRPVKQVMVLMVCSAVRMDCEWARIYERLVPIKCRYDERTRSYKGKLSVIGRIAGQMIELLYALLKRDAEVLRQTPLGQAPPDPTLYDPEIHKAHRQGAYRSMKPQPRANRIVVL
jgi:transposase